MNPMDYIVHFVNGRVRFSVPSIAPYYENRDVIYDCVYIVSDGVEYNLSNVDSIRSIKCPDFSTLPTTDVENELGVTGQLDYVLRMKASRCRSRDENELCSACLWKTTELMLRNRPSWRKEDYNRIVYYHNEMGMFDEAQKAQEYLNSFPCYAMNEFDYYAMLSLQTAISKAGKPPKDLVVFEDFGNGCCSECAKHRGRVYSISGKSKTYPKLPQYALEHGNFHSGCRCCMSIYTGGNVMLRGESVDPLIASNRPYVDDRSDAEIEQYERLLKTLEENERTQHERLDYSISKGKIYIEYSMVKNALGDLAPKTLSAYSRMKKTRSKGFIKIVDALKEKGINIE